MTNLFACPPAAKIASELGLSDDEAQTVRDRLRKGDGLSAVFRALEKNHGFFGVETVVSPKGHALFKYVNSGDVYIPTMVRRHGSTAYRISTVGDEIEALERQGIKAK